jgi:hypothetical protein
MKSSIYIDNFVLKCIKWGHLQKIYCVFRSQKQLEKKHKILGPCLVIYFADMLFTEHKFRVFSEDLGKLQ